MTDPHSDPNRTDLPHADGWCPVEEGAASEAFDMTVFDQQQVWMDRDGTTYWIAELDAEDRGKLTSWLHTHARHFYLQALAGEMVGGPPLTFGSIPEMIFQGADEWMQSTQLLVALDGVENWKDHEHGPG